MLLPWWCYSILVPSPGSVDIVSACQNFISILHTSPSWDNSAHRLITYNTDFRKTQQTFYNCFWKDKFYTLNDKIRFNEMFSWAQHHCIKEHLHLLTYLHNHSANAHTFNNKNRNIARQYYTMQQNIACSTAHVNLNIKCSVTMWQSSSCCCTDTDTGSEICRYWLK